MARYEDRDSGKPGKPYVEEGSKHPVALPSAATKSMVEAWKLIDTVLAGTRAMRAAGRDYLPQHPYETNDAYDDRLEAAVLDNYTLDTLNQLVGKAFKEPPTPADDVPDDILTLLEDVDAEGTAIGPFARAWFRAGVRHGLCHALVDFTALQPKEDGAPRTKADDDREGVRPFWRRLEAPDVLSVQGRMQGGRLMLTQLRYRDDELVEDGEFGERFVERIKVLRPGTYEVWEKKKGQRGGKDKWEMTGSGAYGLPFIPLVSFYTAKRGLGEASQPLEDLAHLNVEHWQSKADQRNILTVARFPMLAVSGVQSTDNQAGGGTIVVGPRKLLTTSDPQAKVYFVEHTGAAVESGVKDLERLEERMGSYAAQFLAKQPGNETATGRALDSAEAISPLQAWGMDFKDCLELALDYTAQWLKKGEGAGGSIEFTIDGDLNLTAPEELTWLTAARAKGDISRQASLEEAKRRRILPDDFDIEEDAERIADEPPPPGTGLDGMMKPPVKKPGAPKAP